MAQSQEIDVDRLYGEIVAAVGELPSRETERLRDLRREFSRRIAQAPPRQVVELGQRLLEEPQTADFVYRFLAYELIAGHKGALRSLGPADVVRLGQGIDSWWSVDTFAPYITGPAWREGQLPDSLIHEWARSPDRWWRRAALVSTIGLNTRARGGKGDTARTLAVCQLLVADRDDMVEKALSWALRSLITHDPDAVRGFLAEHEGMVAARVRREVNNKLTSGLKNPRREARSEK